MGVPSATKWVNTPSGRTVEGCYSTDADARSSEIEAHPTCFVHKLDPGESDLENGNTIGAGPQVKPTRIARTAKGEDVSWERSLLRTTQRGAKR